MFIFKNAWISIIRNKGRNILIGVIIMVIACASTVTLAINNTSSDLINAYEEAYSKELTLSFNRQQMMGNFDIGNEQGREDIKERFENMASYTIDDVKSFADSEFIENYYYTYSLSLNGNNIEKAEIEFESEFGGFGGPSGGRNPMGQMGTSSMDFTLTGYSSIDSMSEFVEGTYTMSVMTDDAWDKAFNGNYAFINEELANYNEIALNDTIILEDSEGTMYELEVIGIYTDNETSTESMFRMFSNSANTIITNADVLETIDKNNDNVKGSVNPTFIIKDYEDVEAIQEEFYEKGLEESYAVQTNQEMVEAGVSSIKNVKSFVKVFLTITLVIGGIVLFILNMINIRERKYEIGVFRTIGISKFKLTMQFMSELLFVASFALIIGAGIGACLSKPVSNTLLASEIQNSMNISDEMSMNFGRPGGGMPTGDFTGGEMPDFRGSFGMVNIQAYDSIDAVVNITVIVELFGIGLLLVLMSSLAAMISIQRFSPLTILKERS